MSDTSLVFNVLARDRASKVFGKIKGAAAVAGVAIGAALTAGMASTMAKSKTDALLAAQLGAGPEMAATLGQASGELYSRGVVDSIEEANAAIKGAIANGLVPDDASSAAIDAVASKVTNLSTVMQEDAGRVSAAVSQMIRTGMVESAEEGFDLLQRGVEMGVNKSGDLLDTFNEYGTQFRQIGIEGPAALGLMSQAIQAGARDSDVAADALKEFAIRSTDGSKAAAESFRALGFDAEKMTAIFAKGGPESAAALDQVLDKLRTTEGQSNAAEIAFGLFGTKAEDLGDALYALDPSAATAGLGDLAGASDRAGEALEDSAGAKVEALKRKLEIGLVGALSSAVGWVENNEGAAKTLAITLGTVAAAVLAVSVAMKVYAAVQAVIKAATVAWTAVQWLLNIAMSANPVGLIIIAIAALIGIVVLIATKTTWFQDLWRVAWDAIKTAAVAVWDFLVAAFQLWWKTFSGFWTGVGEFFVKLWGGIVSGVKTAWTWITDKFDAVVGFVKRLPGRIGKAASGMWDGIKNAFRSALNWLIDKWNGLRLTIPSISVLGREVGGFTLHTKQIPHLADGGIVQASQGGTLALLGEGGRDEAVVPLPRGGGPTAGPSGTLRVIVVGGDPQAVAYFRRLDKQYRLVAS